MEEFDKQLLEANKIGAKTLDELAELEKDYVSQRISYLIANPLPDKLDYNYLKKIHYELFKDVYTFAGQDRYDMNISAVFGKGKSIFTTKDNIPKVSKLLFDELEQLNYYNGFTKEQFLSEAPLFFNELNRLHPFREGNGRTQRLFMNELAIRAGFHLNLNRALKAEMNSACIIGERGNLNKLREMFEKYLLPTKPLSKLTEAMVSYQKKKEYMNDKKKSKNKDFER
jgi:cell filamentation protein